MAGLFITWEVIRTPRLGAKHPELKGKVIVPDVLLQPHNASLEMTFYDEAKQFGSEYKGDIFASEHGSWNKADRAGYEVILVPVKGGKSDGRVRRLCYWVCNSVGRCVGTASRSCGLAGWVADG